jgi:class 3 adenylate cyclase
VADNSAYIQDVLGRYYREASQGLVDIAPSKLNRGQGTQKNFYIFKIDLSNSTQILRYRQQSTYLKLAHTFLSSIDEITCKQGADPNQTEYAGDGVIAYFPENTPPGHILMAAILCREAVLRIRALDSTLNSLPINFRLAIHYAPLVVAKIGRRGDSILSAIGLPIHQVAKMEEQINAGVGRVSMEFYNRLPTELREYLIPVEDSSVPQALGISLLYPNTPSLKIPTPRIVGYNLNWVKLRVATGLNI